MSTPRAELSPEAVTDALQEAEEAEPSPARHGYVVNLALFAATAGWIVVWYQGTWVDGATYAAGILAILLAHEFGHYFAARHYGVEVTLPYFIPGLPPFYTFGAFIKMRTGRMTRRALLVIGAAGPIAGVLVAVPVYVAGIALSETLTMPPLLAPNEMLVFGDSLLGRFVVWCVFGELGEGVDVLLHPLAAAGWVGLFVTAFNLVPVGQLDGGHIGYALFGRGYSVASRWLFRGLVICGALLNPAWLVLSVFLLLTGVEHPPVVTDEPLPRWTRVVGYASLGLFALTFIPQPVQLDSLVELVLAQLAS